MNIGKFRAFEGKKLCHDCAFFERGISVIGHCRRRSSLGRDGKFSYVRITDERTDGKCGQDAKFFRRKAEVAA